MHLLQRPTTRLILIGLVLLTVQTTLLADIRPFGVNADVMLGASIAAGIVGGAERGALAGFIFGLMYDLLLITPFGLSPLAYGLAAFSMGALRGVITVGQAPWLSMLLVFAGSGAGIVAFAGVGTILGQRGWVQLHLVEVVAIVGGINALIAVPIGKVMKWALRVEREQ